MSVQPDYPSVASEHGAWGEGVAAEFLRLGGYVIVSRNDHPVKSDERYEIDIVAYDKKDDTIVFIEVKQHAHRTPFQRRLRSIDERKKRNLRRAFNSWRRVNKWHGGYRFDVIEIYGTPGHRPEIDHIVRVPIFARPDRFVRWC